MPAHSSERRADPTHRARGQLRGVQRPGHAPAAPAGQVTRARPGGLRPRSQLAKGADSRPTSRRAAATWRPAAACVTAARRAPPRPGRRAAARRPARAGAPPGRPPRQTRTRRTAPRPAAPAACAARPVGFQQCARRQGAARGRLHLFTRSLFQKRAGAPGRQAELGRLRARAPGGAGRQPQARRARRLDGAHAGRGVLRLGLAGDRAVAPACRRPASAAGERAAGWGAWQT